MNEFEKKLQQQQFRSLPEDWREQILGTQPTTANQKQRFLSTLKDQMTALLWPHPKAWAGIAAAWILVIAFNISTKQGDGSSLVAAKIPVQQILNDLREQRQLFAELARNNSVPVAEPPKSFTPPPHSEWRSNSASA